MTKESILDRHYSLLPYRATLAERFNAADAARKLKVSRTSIKNYLRGHSKTCNKSIFKYATV